MNDLYVAFGFFVFNLVLSVAFNKTRFSHYFEASLFVSFMILGYVWMYWRN